MNARGMFAISLLLGLGSFAAICLGDSAIFYVFLVVAVFGVMSSWSEMKENKKARQELADG